MKKTRKIFSKCLALALVLGVLMGAFPVSVSAASAGSETVAAGKHSISVSYDYADIENHVADTSKLGTVTPSATSASQGEIITLRVNSLPAYAAIRVVYLDYTPTGSAGVCRYELTGDLKFEMPDSDVVITPSYMVNRSNGYYKATIEVYDYEGTYSSASFDPDYPRGAGEAFNFAAGATDRIVKGGISCRVLTQPDPNANVSLGSRIAVRYYNQNGTASTNVMNSNVYDAPNSDQRVLVYFSKKYSVYCTDLLDGILYLNEDEEYPLYTDQTEYIPGQPVFIHERTRIEEFNKYPDDSKVYMMYYVAGGKLNYCTRYSDSDPRYYFIMPEHNTYAAMKQVFYVDVKTNVTGEGTVRLSADRAINGDVISVNTTPAEGYRLKSITLSSDIQDRMLEEPLPADITDSKSFTMPMASAYYSLRGKTITVNAEFEKDICEVTVKADGTNEEIKVSVPSGTKFYDAMENAGVYSALDNMETDDRLFREIVTKPLADFENEDEYTDDAFELINSTITGNMTVYATFFTKIKNVSLELKRPEAGVSVTLDGDTQSIVPEITLAKNQNCALYDDPKWTFGNMEELNLSYEGTFNAAETFYVEMMLVPDFGYWLDCNTAVSATGVELEEVTGRMAIGVVLSAKPMPLLGDANCDGILNVRDLTAIQRHIDESSLLTGDRLIAADINIDGTVDINDATALQRYFAEYETNYRIGKSVAA